MVLQPVLSLDDDKMFGCGRRASDTTLFTRIVTQAFESAYGASGDAQAGLDAACSLVIRLGEEFFPDEASFPAGLAAKRLEGCAAGLWPQQASDRNTFESWVQVAGHPRPGDLPQWAERRYIALRAPWLQGAVSAGLGAPTIWLRCLSIKQLASS